MATANGNYQHHRYNMEVSVAESSAASPKSIRTNPSSEDLIAGTTSPRPCLCSPTTHEGSFRCRLHRSSSNNWGKNPLPTAKQSQHAKSVEAQ